MTYENDLEQHFLVHLHKFLIPFLDLCGLLPRVRLIVVGLRGIISVVLAPLDDFAENSLIYLEGVVSGYTMRLGMVVERTLGIGMGLPWMASSPRSSNIFLIRRDLSATARSTACVSSSSSTRNRR